MNQYNLNQRTLSDYKNNFIYSLRLCSKSGRPRALDDEAIDSLAQKLLESPLINEYDLRRLIRAKRRDCWNKYYYYSYYYSCGGC
jgi:hypothetical protein